MSRLLPLGCGKSVQKALLNGGNSIPASKLEASVIPPILNGPFNWVNGQLRNPVEAVGVDIKNLEPRTDLLLCNVPNSGAGEVDAAVKAARDALPAWRALSGAERGRLLYDAATKLRERSDDIAALDVLDNGKPIWEAKCDMDTVITCLEYYGGLAPAINGQHVRMPGGSFAMVTREPYGVVAGIGPWNYPLQSCTWKVAPALACGNTFVYKPSPLTPLTALALAEVLKDAGVPDGVFNVIQGGAETGSLLTGHEGCDKLSFTGSVPTGTAIMKAGAESIKAVSLELGGKSPLIIFEDADVTNAVKGALMANFLSQGQVCSNGTRVFVQKSIFTEFVAKFREQAEKMTAGDPFDEDNTTIGASICKEQAEKVLGYIRRAKEAGAKVECGGERLSMPGVLGGYYISPCILTNVTDDMEVVREEIFGSVACVLPFDTEDEVVKRANDTPFGLGGGVFTQNLQRAHRVADSLEVGSCWVNTFNLAPCEVPFGGFKGSGIGRENGLAAVEFFSQQKSIYVEMNDVDCGPLYRS